MKNMDFSNYKNSKMICDQSGLQQIGFTLVQDNPIDVLGFLEQQKITVWVPAEGKNELGYQAYKPNLLSGTYNDTNSSAALNNSYVLSRINASLTPACLQPNGFDVVLVESNALYSKTFEGQIFLWDATPVMQKLLKNTRSSVDPANIKLARCFQQKCENVFVFLNDQKQIDQLKYENIKYLRPDKLFTWMCKENYINPRKGVWNFIKRRNHNKRWTEPNTNFKNLIN